MTQQSSQPSVEALRALQPFKTLDTASLESLAEQVRIFNAPRKSTLVELGSEEPSTLFLIDGEIELIASDGNSFRITALDETARQPLCQLRPTRYHCRAISNVLYLRIEDDVLNQFLSLENHSSMFDEETLESYSVIETLLDPGNESQELLIAQILDALVDGRLVLPSLNIVAQKVGRALLAADKDPRKLSRALMLDPSLTAKTIKAVNKDLQGSEQPVHTCDEAVERLGAENIGALAVSCALRETLRRPRPEIDARMQTWWERSLRVSAVSEVLARQSERFDPALAALAGLLHRIGEAAILGYANELAPALPETQLDEFIKQHTQQISFDLLSIWNHPPELLTVASEAGNLERNTRREADYADIVLVAERHADIGYGPCMLAQPLDQMPAFQRLGFGEASPSFSMTIMRAATSAMQQANAVLAA